MIRYIRLPDSYNVEREMIQYVFAISPCVYIIEQSQAAQETPE